MSHLPTDELEGRLNAQRETLAIIAAHIAYLETCWRHSATGIIETLEEHVQFQDHQEDPGAVPTGTAFAIEGGSTREFRLILEEVRARFSELRES
ncbi:hypothetical protein [Chelativorans sp. M5D2P16]|uniref:hypothetical protein n=1 Tax=Chelativorans sp. M5D2P16 TaxID=3095678 RepID=UPI002ACAC7F1|nr:hypothetical protein [Chelativorans sp. M5D2P16]MDZ5699039.1 hypothetical protein [Chelativorans sp. M5D2P16]